MSTAQSKAEEITAILRTEILTGQYRAGERLPSERELAARFEANRGAIREAIKKLEQLGIATVNPGGVRVVPVEEATLGVLGYLLELGEIRRPELVSQTVDVLGAMMALSARSAVAAADQDDLDELQTLVANLISSIGDNEQHHDNWLALGEKMMSIHGNLVLRLVGNGVRTQFIANLGTPDEEPIIDQGAVRTALESVHEAIGHRDASLAGDAMVQHFQIIKDGLVAWTESESATGEQNQRRSGHG